MWLLGWCDQNWRVPKNSRKITVYHIRKLFTYCYTNWLLIIVEFLYSGRSLMCLHTTIDDQSSSNLISEWWPTTQVITGAKILLLECNCRPWHQVIHHLLIIFHLIWFWIHINKHTLNWTFFIQTIESVLYWLFPSFVLYF
jgi:hypothetical protein